MLPVNDLDIVTVGIIGHNWINSMITACCLPLSIA